jgi:hypothetical protein
MKEKEKDTCGLNFPNSTGIPSFYAVLENKCKEDFSKNNAVYVQSSHGKKIAMAKAH